MYVCAFSSFLQRHTTSTRFSSCGLAGGAWLHEQGEPTFAGMLTQVTISYQTLQITEEGSVQSSWGGEKGRC